MQALIKSMSLNISLTIRRNGNSLPKIISFILVLSTSSSLTLFAQKSDNSLRTNIQTIVWKLKKENILHLGAPVGEAGKPETNNKYYKLYKRLAAKAVTEELVSLTNDSSRLIVLYAFNILSSRGYSGLKDIFLQHVSDTTEIWIAGGCTGAVVKVNSYMLSYLNPKYYQSSKVFLTKEEYDMYLALVDKSQEP